MRFFLPLFIFLCICQNAEAQTNQLIYQQFIEKLSLQEGQKFLSYNGYEKSIDSLFFSVDSTATKRLLPQKWEIAYHKLGKKQLQRNVSLEMRIMEQDSIRIFKANYQDTLSKKEIKNILKAESPDFQGKTPFWQELYLKPVVIITSSVAAIFLLFYVRSR